MPRVHGLVRTGEAKVVNGHTIIAATERKVRKARKVSQFQMDLKMFNSDPLVRSLARARKEVFNSGENGIEAITKMLKSRIEDLRVKGMQ